MNAAPWRNRIVGHADVPPADLFAHDGNWRLHGERQRAAVRANLGGLGLIKSVQVNRRTGRIVDGHLRVELAIEDGQPTVPVEYLHLTDDEERRALATLDALGQLATADVDAYAALVDDLSGGDWMAELAASVRAGAEQAAAAAHADIPEPDQQKPTPAPTADGRPAMGKGITLTADQREGVDEAFAAFRRKHATPADGPPLSDGQIVVLMAADWMAGN